MLFFFFFFFLWWGGGWGGGGGGGREGVGEARTQGAVPRFIGTTQNTGTTTKHRNDHSNMKKIPSWSDDGGGRGKKGFECICSLFL